MHKTFGVVSFLLFTLFGLLKLTITFSAILSLGRFGDHILLFSGSTAMMLVFQATCFQISCDFFFHPTDRPTQNILVFCFVLFFFVGKELKLYKDPQYSLWRFSNAHKKNAMIY